MELGGTGGMRWNRRNTTECHGTLSDVITSFSFEKRHDVIAKLLQSILYFHNGQMAQALIEGANGIYIRTTSLSLSQTF